MKLQTRRGAYFGIANGRFADATHSRRTTHFDEAIELSCSWSATDIMSYGHSQTDSPASFQWDMPGPVIAHRRAGRCLRLASGRVTHQCPGSPRIGRSSRSWVADPAARPALSAGGP